MKTRLRIFAGVSVLILVTVAVAWFTFFRDKQQPVVEQPQQAQPKTTAELLVGSWKEIYPERAIQPNLFEVVHHFAQDGKYEIHVWDSARGNKVIASRYRLEGNIIRFDPLEIDTPGEEILERVTKIEKLTNEQLVLITVTKTRWTPEMAKKLAAIRDVPLDQILAEAREDKSQTVCTRVQNQ
jgi:hypothetical protein